MKARNGFRPVWMLLFAGAVLGTLVGLARTSLAQAPAAKPASQPGDVDLANSRVFTFVGATGFGHEHGVEGRLVSGNIQLGANQNAGRAGLRHEIVRCRYAGRPQICRPAR